MATRTTREHTIEDEGGRRPGAEIHREPFLFLLLEGTRPLAGGARHALGAIDRVTIGRHRSRTADRAADAGGRALSLGVPDRRMSTAHALIVRRAGGAFAVEDLGSTNGSRVNGHELRAPVELADGDVIEVGRTLFLFRDGLPTSGQTSGQATEDIDASHLDAARPELATLVPSYEAACAALLRIAPSQLPVLVLGPTGAGKELVARAVHAASLRAGPFVAVNTGALPATLVEAQLFGHVRGAFTGAAGDEPGFVRSANGGTLFLDEIADLALPAQAALLRVLQESEVTPVGSTRALQVDVRVVAATHADLEARCRSGAFREDLLARLAGFLFHVPPLRDRREDLGLLVASVLRQIAPNAALELSADAARAIALYPWPRNVRELKQALTSASVLASPGSVIEVTHLPAAVAATARARGAPPPPADAEGDAEGELRQKLVALLTQHGGNIAQVARAMGKARMQIQRWVKRLEIDVETFRR
jgi:DNA-binding NtrC family response regulator